MDQPDSERCIAWTRAARAEMRRFGSGGLYLNVAGVAEDKEALVRAGYGANYEQLVALKARYDPDNLFRMNQDDTLAPRGIGNVGLTLEAVKH